MALVYNFETTMLKFHLLVSWGEILTLEFSADNLLSEQFVEYYILQHKYSTLDAMLC